MWPEVSWAGIRTRVCLGRQASQPHGSSLPAQEVSSLLDSNSDWGLWQAILGLWGWRNAPSQQVGVQAAWDGTVRVRRWHGQNVCIGVRKGSDSTGSHPSNTQTPHPKEVIIYVFPFWILCCWTEGFQIIKGESQFKYEIHWKFLVKENLQRKKKKKTFYLILKSVIIIISNSFEYLSGGRHCAKSFAWVTSNLPFTEDPLWASTEHRAWYLGGACRYQRMNECA